MAPLGETVEGVGSAAGAEEATPAPTAAAATAPVLTGERGKTATKTATLNIPKGKVKADTDKATEAGKVEDQKVENQKVENQKVEITDTEEGMEVVRVGVREVTGVEGVEGTGVEGMGVGAEVEGIPQPPAPL